MPNTHLYDLAPTMSGASPPTSTATQGCPISRGSASSNLRTGSAVHRYLATSTSESKTSPRPADALVIGMRGASRMADRHGNVKSCRPASSRGAGSPSPSRPSPRLAAVKVLSHSLITCTTPWFAKSLRAVNNGIDRDLYRNLYQQPRLGDHATNQPANQLRHGLRGHDSSNLRRPRAKSFKVSVCLTESRQRQCTLNGGTAVTSFRKGMTSSANQPGSFYQLDRREHDKQQT